MNGTFLSPIQSKWAVHFFLFFGLLINSLLHLYRFAKINWTHVTGLIGNSQSIKWSFLLTLWVLVPLCFTKLIDASMRKWWPSVILFSFALLIINQTSGRSVLKLLFDILLVGVFLGWFMIDTYYGHYLLKPPSKRAYSYVVSELIIIFQTSLALLTFVIATFGFSFAPNYIQKYYQQNIGQPTVWWFSVLTAYLAVGIIGFICLHAWLIAVKLRSSL